MLGGPEHHAAAIVDEPAQRSIGDRRWPARLSLTLERRRNRTTIVRKRHHGPLMVQSPFYPGDGSCHVYLLHPPGGLVGGDQLEIETSAGPNTHTLLTTHAATKFYRSDGRRSSQSQTIQAGCDARVEWVPQENILFSGADVTSTTQISLTSSSRLLAWESWCLGRPAADECFDAGQLVQTLKVHIDGEPALVERLNLRANSATATAPWGFDNRSANALVLAYPVAAEHAESLRETCPSPAGGDAGITVIDGLLIARARAQGSRELNEWSLRVWQHLRPTIMGCVGEPPRIWAT